MEPEEIPEQRLERLRLATQGVRARPGLAARVMTRVVAEQSWQEALLAPAWRLLPVAFCAAAAACGLAYWSDQGASAALVWAEEPAGTVLE